MDGVDRIEKILLAAGMALMTVGSALAWQMPWREYPGQDNIEIPSDYQEKTEWCFARLMYPPFAGAIHGRGGYRRFGGDWKTGRSSWNADSDPADRHLSAAVPRSIRVPILSVAPP